MPKQKEGGKYRPEVLDIIYKILEENGTDTDACKGAGISKETFYTWLRIKPEFKQKVEEIKQARLIKTSQPLLDRKEIAESFIDQVIQGKKFKKKIINKQVLNRQGEIVTLTEEHLEEVLPTPQMLERILGKEEIEELEIKLSLEVKDAPD